MSLFFLVSLFFNSTLSSGTELDSCALNDQVCLQSISDQEIAPMPSEDDVKFLITVNANTPLSKRTINLKGATTVSKGEIESNSGPGSNYFVKIRKIEVDSNHIKPEKDFLFGSIENVLSGPKFFYTKKYPTIEVSDAFLLNEIIENNSSKNLLKFKINIKNIGKELVGEWEVQEKTLLLNFKILLSEFEIAQKASIYTLKDEVNVTITVPKSILPSRKE